MKRHTCQPRVDWPERVSRVGLAHHSHESGPYWDESAFYELSAADVANLEAAGQTLHALCLEAAEAVVEQGWWSRLGIPPAAAELAAESWERDDFSVYGRFDLALTPDQPPRLLEYNADTPTGLIEASVAQWFWLQDVDAALDQFNSIHERLIEAWRRWNPASPVHFAGVRDHVEDEQTVLYLRDTCEQAGISTVPIFVDEIGWDAGSMRFVDLENRAIERCFKLYPWEWLCAEEFAPHLKPSGIRCVEPAWKMILSNKGLLPILWELFPDHPNLLAAFDDPSPLGASYVRKPRLGREGANVTLVENGVATTSLDGPYAQQPAVYQAVAPLSLDGLHHPVFGLWMVDHEAAGVGIREDTSRITNNLSRFVPHLIR